MNKIFFLLGLCFTLAAEGKNLIAHNKKTDYVIVFSNREKKAAQELKFHLEKITGARFKIIEEHAGRSYPAKAFYLGDTAFARKKGFDCSRLGREEWRVRTFGPSIVITGGVPRGTLYGVYELAEKKLNCRYFAWDTMVFPPQKTLYLDKNPLAGKPSFDSRELYDDYYRAPAVNPEVYKKAAEFRYRIRSSCSGGKRALSNDVTKQYSGSHSFYYLLDPNKYFPTNPEYFSMDAAGKRFRGTKGSSKLQGGNMCLSNPRVVDIVWNSLSRFIEKDRIQNHSSRWPYKYSVTQMDSSKFICLCPECKKISRREGSESGLLIHFLNQLAERAEKQYPDVEIRSIAYVSTKKAPRYIRPRKNINLEWCNLYSLNDCYRPITSPFNADQRKEFEEWGKSGVKLHIYEYWNMGGAYFSPHRVETCIDAIIVNLPYFYKHGSRGYFAEFQPDYDRQYVQNFAYLQNYVAYKLLLDIHQDPEKLIREFMKGFYGPAAGPMTKFLTLVRTAVKNEKMRMRAFERIRPYCDQKFMAKVWGHLLEAYRLTKPGTLYRAHVEQEMLTPINVILRNQWPVGDAEWMKKFYKDLRSKRIAVTIAAPRFRKQMLDKLQSDLYSFVKVDLKVPEKFKGREVIMLGWPFIRQLPRVHTANSWVDDPEAAGGKALAAPRQDLKLFNMVQKKLKTFTPLDFGIYDPENKRGLKRSFRGPIPQDEKYHWYKIGTFDLSQSTFVWGFYWQVQCSLTNYYRNADGLDNMNKWTIYVSAKFTGPAFVKNSKKRNDVLWDQVMLVKEK